MIKNYKIRDLSKSSSCKAEQALIRVIPEHTEEYVRIESVVTTPQMDFFRGY